MGHGEGATCGQLYYGEIYQCADCTTREAIADHQLANARYEHVRKLNPHQFANLYLQNISGGGTFNELVDRAIAEQKAKKCP